MAVLLSGSEPTLEESLLLSCCSIADENGYSEIEAKISQGVRWDRVRNHLENYPFAPSSCVWRALERFPQISEKLPADVVQRIKSIHTGVAEQNERKLPKL